MLSVLAAATLWGSIGPSYALLAERQDADPIDIVTIRAAAATVLFLMWVLVRQPAALHVRRRDVPAFMAFGLVTVTAFYPILIYAFRETSVTVAALLLYLAPAIVTVTAALFLGEPLSMRKTAALALSFGGLALVVGAYQPGNLIASPLGILLGLASAVCYAAYSIIGKPLLDRYPRSAVLAYHLLIGTAGLLIVRQVMEGNDWPGLGTIVLAAGYNGIFTTLAPIALYTLGLSALPSSEASLLAMWEPVVALALATMLLGEVISPAQVAGAALIFASGTLLVAPGRKSAALARVPR